MVDDQDGALGPPLDGQPRARRAKRGPMQVGEPIVIGREPADPVVITVQAGQSMRQIKLWTMSMSDVVDVICGALREVANVQAQATKRR
jgi:hypothetical protein